jgi:hypothetical protein
MEGYLHGFLDELTKIAALRLDRGLLALHLGHEKVREGTRRHEEMMRAIKEGYPAGWVALGMKPKR